MHLLGTIFSGGLILIWCKVVFPRIKVNKHVVFCTKPKTMITMIIINNVS